MKENQLEHFTEPSLKRPARRRRSAQELANIREQRAFEGEKATAEYNAAAQAAVDRISRLKAARERAASSD